MRTGMAPVPGAPVSQGWCGARLVTAALLASARWYASCQTHWGNPHLLKLSIPETDGGLFVCRAAFFQRLGNKIQAAELFCNPSLTLFSLYCSWTDSTTFHIFLKIIFHPGECLLQLALLQAALLSCQPYARVASLRPLFYVAVQLWQVSSAAGWKPRAWAGVQWSKSACHSVF